MFFFKLFVLCLLCSTHLNAKSNYSIVFVHLGEHVPNHLYTAVKQARYMNEQCDIYLLVNRDAHKSLQKTQSSFLSNYSVSLINVDALHLLPEHQLFKQASVKVGFPKGFWAYALERFFYLHDFVSQYKVQNLIHLESDTLLYVNVEELMPYFETYNVKMAAPFESLVACIPCFVFVKDTDSLRSLLIHVTYEMNIYKGTLPQIEVGDMHTLASFRKKYGESHLLSLPTLMPEYTQFYTKLTSSYKPDNETPLEFLVQNAALFPGYLFDAAALGVFANGNDRAYNPSSKPGTIHHRSLFDPGHFSFFWGEDSSSKKVPYFTFKGRLYRVVNLHLHSKLPDEFTSYADNRASFPETR